MYFWVEIKYPWFVSFPTRGGFLFNTSRVRQAHVWARLPAAAPGLAQGRRTHAGSFTGERAQST